eukprot:scaffold10550_cov271-Chaetoceros_neogracile.AAC.12
MRQQATSERGDERRRIPNTEYDEFMTFPRIKDHPFGTIHTLTQAVSARYQEIDLYIQDGK